MAEATSSSVLAHAAAAGDGGGPAGSHAPSPVALMTCHVQAETVV